MSLKILAFAFVTLYFFVKLERAHDTTYTLLRQQHPLENISSYVFISQRKVTQGHQLAKFFDICWYFMVESNVLWLVIFVTQ
jgi:hypothetical protein